MEKNIAYCGLDCYHCDARIATVNDDDMMREKVAKLWSELNNAEITAEMINCTGCRIDGPKTPFCDSICLIRKCASCKGFETCGDCPDLDTCDTVKMITGNNEEAYHNLRI